MLRAAGHRTVVIDNRPDTVWRMRAQGIRAYLGELGAIPLRAAAIAPSGGAFSSK